MIRARNKLYPYGPNIAEIIEYKGLAKEVLDKSRVKKFLKKTDKVTANHNDQPRRGKTRFKHNGVDFACNLVSAKCCAKRKGGGKCSRDVTRGLFLCWQHTTKIYKVRINKSKIPVPGGGIDGLYACAPFIKGQQIIPYFGEKLTQQELDSRFPGDATAPYAMTASNVRRQGSNSFPNKKYIDSACFQAMGSMANRGTGPYKTNAHFKQTAHFFTVLRATKGIQAGKEVYASYGRGGYQLSDSGNKPHKAAKEKKTKCR
jgi:hypothetical protein